VENPLPKDGINKSHGLGDGINLLLGMTLVAILAGCMGYVDSGYDGAVVVPQPEPYFYGGVYERGPDVRIYSHRGFVSRREGPRTGAGITKGIDPHDPWTEAPLAVL